MNVFITGGSGFVGRHLCEKLVRQGHSVTVLTRQRSSARAVQHLPGLTVLEGDVYNTDEVAKLLRGHDALIHLVAILHGNEASFDRVHAQLPQRLAQACHAAQVRRVVHVSAIGVAEDAPSMYLRSKARGEAAWLQSGLDVRVLRPSVIFGADDRFTNLFASLQKTFPILPLAGANARFAPVWVENVANALVKLLQWPRTLDGQRIWQACGPEELSLADIVRRCGLRSGHARPIVPLPAALGSVQAALMEFMPGPTLMSRDNLHSMQVPNVADPLLPGLDALGIRAHSLR
jgi:NADH dehydrogenase